MADSENTQQKRKGEHLAAYQFKPGNPGRPKGARNKLGEEFLQDMLADWTEHGAKVIEDVRKDKPDQYLKVVASVLPKELNVKVSELDELTDDQIAQQLAFISAQLARAGVAVGSGDAAEIAPQSVN
jgi:hypothetical protein